MFEKWKREQKERKQFETLIDEEFSERFRQAYLKDPSPEHAPKRPLDLSFMEEKKRRKKARIRRAHVAVACLLIFLLSSLIGVQLNNRSSLAFDHPLEKILHYITGAGYTTAPSPGGAEDKSQTVRVTDQEKIDAALRLMPQLLVPEYLPEGWEMESLEVTKKTEDSCSAMFVFRNAAKENIRIVETSEKESVTAAQEPGEIIRLSNREVYYDSGETTGEPTVHFIENQVLVQVKGALVKDELLQIAAQMRQPE